MRASKVGAGWLILAVNTERSPVKAATISVTDLPDANLKCSAQQQPIASSGGRFSDDFAPLEAKVYTRGISP